jgi:protein-S-isoprenylcysteine O-methyltransferase Ste14
MEKKSIRKVLSYYILDQSLGIIGAGVALFWSAGRMDWPAAWAALAVWLAVFTAMDIILLRFNPELMIERLSPPKSAKSWDRTILSLLRLTQLIRYILAGLDLRYGWTGGFPVAVQVTAWVVCALSYGILIWAMASNTFFSQVVRIQTDRGHTVSTQGPYRYMRHPGYVGMIFFELGMAILLSSWWALFASGLCVLLILLRTALEDKTLQKELKGYANYSQEVRYRLFPGIW